MDYTFETVGEPDPPATPLPQDAVQALTKAARDLTDAVRSADSLTSAREQGAMANIEARLDAEAARLAAIPEFPDVPRSEVEMVMAPHLTDMSGSMWDAPQMSDLGEAQAITNMFDEILTALRGVGHELRIVVTEGETEGGTVTCFVVATPEKVQMFSPLQFKDDLVHRVHGDEAPNPRRRLYVHVRGRDGLDVPTVRVACDGRGEDGWEHWNAKVYVHGALVETLRWSVL